MFGPQARLEGYTYDSSCQEIREEFKTVYFKRIRQSYKSFPGKKKKYFVLGTIGFGGCNGTKTENEEIIYEAQKSISRKMKNVLAVDTRPFWRDKSVSPVGTRSHYNHNAETYMEVGNALGHGMIDLMFGTNDYVQEQC